MKKRKLILPVLLLLAPLTSCDDPVSSSASGSPVSSVTSADKESGVSSPVSSVGTSSLESREEPSSDSVSSEVRHWNDDGVLKILEVGNSFGEDTFGYAPKLLQDLGVERYVIGKLYYGGCSLDGHYEFLLSDTTESGSYEFRYIDETSQTWTLRDATSLRYALSFDSWDFISLQQSSAASGVASTYGHLDDILDFIDSENPYAYSEYVWNMTWAYPEGGGAPELEAYQNDSDTMYESIARTVQDVVLGNDRIRKILVPGTAIQNASTSYLKGKLHRDDRHLSYVHGRFIAGMTYFCGLIGRDAEDVTLTPLNMSESDRAVCVESASNALKQQFIRTASAYEVSSEVRFSGIDSDFILEAEEGILDGVNAKISGCENASGGAIACDFNNCGQGLFFTYYAPVGGTHDLEVSYWTASVNSKQDLYVNGIRQGTILYDQDTGWANGFNEAATAHSEITLQQGYNTIHLIKYGTAGDTPAYGGYVQLDYLKIKGSGESYDPEALDLSVPSFRIEAEVGYYHTSTAAPVPVDSAGNGYVVGEINKEGDGVDFSFLVPEDGTYELRIVYGKGSGANPVDIALNGGEAVTYALEDYDSQAWNVFHVSQAAATLTLSSTEKNHLSITRSAGGNWFCFDAIELNRIA